MNNDDIIEDWNESDMCQIFLDDQEDFLKIKETLSRIGIGSVKEGIKTLYPSCHILQKRGLYYIVHFKELFALDGKNFNLTFEDVFRRDAIANLLEEWGLCRIVEPDLHRNDESVHLRVLKFSDKKDWNIVPKYNIGNN